VRIVASVAASFVGQGRMVDDIWRVFATDAKSRNEIKNVVRDALEGWAQSGQLLVVFVDDLDRCPADRIIEVCEAIKLYLDVPGLVFVLACDQAVLRRAVRESAGATEAVEYLEKIIQLNYRIPAPSESTATALVDSYLTRSGTAPFFDDAMRSLVIERTGRNPRRIKGLINSFVLEYQLTPEWSEFGAENLIKVILLQHFYPSFYRDLVDPRTGDPAEDFLHYIDFRTSVRQGGVAVSVALAELFTANDLTPPTDTAGPTELAELEKQLPEEFTRLATDRDFVSLMQSMRDALRSDMLRRLLRKPLNQPIPTPMAEFTGPNLDRLSGLRVLWIDDDPRGNAGLAGELTEHGAQVVTATDRSEAIKEFARWRPDVVLSDITRHSDSNAGLDDLEFFRHQHLHDGPVIFYTGSISAARRQRAEDLDASITTETFEVLRLLTALPRPVLRD
jgi:CheY-like chemotaxis protein